MVSWVPPSSPSAPSARLSRTRIPTAVPPFASPYARWRGTTRFPLSRGRETCSTYPDIRTSFGSRGGCGSRAADSLVGTLRDAPTSRFGQYVVWLPAKPCVAPGYRHLVPRRGLRVWAFQLGPWHVSEGQASYPSLRRQVVSLAQLIPTERGLPRLYSRSTLGPVSSGLHPYVFRSSGLFVFDSGRTLLWAKRQLLPCHRFPTGRNPSRHPRLIRSPIHIISQRGGKQRLTRPEPSVARFAPSDLGPYAAYLSSICVFYLSRCASLPLSRGRPSCLISREPRHQEDLACVAPGCFALYLYRP